MKLEELLKQEFEEDAKTIAQAKKGFLSSDDLSLITFSNNVKKYQQDNSAAHRALLDGEKKCVALRDKRLVNEKNFEDSERVYSEAKSNMAKGLIYLAYCGFAKIKSHKDASKLHEQCESILKEKYDKADQYRQETNYNEAIKLYEECSDYKDSKDLLSETLQDKSLYPKREEIYTKAMASLKDEDYYHAYKGFKSLPSNYKDTDGQLFVCDGWLSSNYDDAKSLMAAKKYIEAIAAFEELHDYRDSEALIKECNNAIAKAKKDAIDAIKAKKQHRIDAIKGFFVGAFVVFSVVMLFAPITFAVVFAVLLFSNRVEIVALGGSFGGWTTGWVFYLIGAIVLTIVAIVFLVKDGVDSGSTITSFVATGYTILFCIISFVNYAKIPSNFNPANDIVLTSRSKEDNYNSTRIYFTVENKGVAIINKFIGQMKFYDRNGSQVASYYVYFSGDYNPGCYNSTYVDFQSPNYNFYNTSYNDLGITYHIQTMCFGDDYYTEYGVNGSVVTIKRSGSSSNSYNDLSQDDDGDDSQLVDSNLQKLRSIAGQNAIMPDNYEYILDEGELTKYSYYNYEDHDAYYFMFTVAEENLDTFFSDFITKLLDNGFEAKLDDGYDYEYHKGQTALLFENVRESTTYSSGQYIHNYWYFNFYGYSLY